MKSFRQFLKESKSIINVDSFLNDGKKEIQKQFDTDIKTDLKNEAKRIKQETKFQQDLKKNEEKWNNFINKLINKVKNNPNAKYYKIGSLKNIPLKDVLNGEVKGSISNSGKSTIDTDSFYDGTYYIDKFSDEVTEYFKKFRQDIFYNDYVSAKKTVKYQYDNPLQSFVDSGFLTKKYGNISLNKTQVSNNKLEFPWLRDEYLPVEPVMKEMRNVLKKNGWVPYHSSGKRVVSSSSYYEKDGNTLRLSDHELPMTPERQYNTDMGFRKGWDREYILDNNYDIIKYYLCKDQSQFEKLFFEEMEG